MHATALFLGHLHPAWVHLPIGIFLLLALLEAAALLARVRGLGWLPPLPERQRTLILAAGTLAAAVAAALGWLLARGGDYDRALVHRHQLLGLAAAAGAVVLLVVHRRRRLYLAALPLFLVLLTVAGHAGGQLTHGSDFLTANLPGRLRALLGAAPAPVPPPPPDFDHAAVFADVVQPILAGRCVNCHGPAKSSGGLRLDSWEVLAKGGKHGPLFKGSDLAGSELIRRLELPPGYKEHMPPRGKPPLSPDDLTVLEWWVGAGAPRETRVAAIDLPTAIDEILGPRLGRAPEPAPDRAATLAAAAPTAASLGIVIRSMSPDGPWLDVNAAPAGRAFGDLDLARLLPLAPAIVWLDLDGTAVTEGGMPALEAMHRLERLHLAGLPVGDASLAHLSHLRRLQYLNLRGTRVTDRGLPALRPLSELRALYVWQTAVTPAAVKALGDGLIDARKVALWTAERDQLDQRIAAERFEGNTGESLRPPAPPVAAK